MTWNKDKDIFALMVGHGKSLDGSWDSGCVYGKYSEAKLMLPIVQTAVKYLRKSGVRVITDADQNNNKNMKACVAWANREKAKFYMSVHCDYKLATAGVAPLYVSNNGKTMATRIGKSIAKQLGMKWKGAFYRKDLYELNATNQTSVILETGAIRSDLKYLKDYKRYGKALAVAICKYIGVKPFEHSTAWYLRVAAKKITAYMKKHKFKYKASWLDNSLTWKGAKKRKTTNCSTMVCYALQEIGVLKEGQYFWINGDKITCKGGLTLAKLKKVATIKHTAHSPKYAHLKKGDICGYKNNAHTQIFAGFNKAGNPTWYSTGSDADIRSGKAHVKKSYNHKLIYTIIRLK